MKLKPPSKQPAIRISLLPKDTNPEGSIFGGVILSLIDQAAAVEANRQAPRRYVTVAMDAIEFKKPIFVGDIVSLWASGVKVGRTSIRIHVEVLARSRHTDVDELVTSADVTMVAVDENRRPIAVFNSRETED